MKVLIVSGSHPRHYFALQDIVKKGYDCSAIIMKRENLLLKPPLDIENEDKELFIKHFEERYKIENKVFGELTEEVFGDINKYFCDPSNLNSDETANFVRTVNADIAIIFGPDIIKKPVIDILPNEKINIHLGLSPWYKGSATLFWPFYFLEPQFCGATFHNITTKADAGDILHQTIPELNIKDGIHDVGVKTVIAARRDLSILLKKRENIDRWSFKKQKGSGKLFLTSDFKPYHLRSIYLLFENKIVEKYLKGELKNQKPKIIKGF